MRQPWKQRSEREHGSRMKRHLLGHMKEHYLLDHVKKRNLHRPQKRGYLHGQPTRRHFRRCIHLR
ncbi:hypothetical protein PR003_g20529 [Phytophthora rubi]|uniref:Uncharacterized protein n=1 Tax=Phytophthora rubi TaxID=129364 RepID=A0A6A4DQ04_9STRA|nr:hypothetical protein PR002_g20240 [Phytophthora rubi]KAE9309367.1 hypothetical protein PR003_g20529 [Phytophthora rubi]